MPEPKWLSSEEMRMWRSFLAASISVISNIESDLMDQSGLSLDDYEVLVHLSESAEGRLLMTDLSDRLNSPQSRLSQRIDRMEKRGLVASEDSSSDADNTYAVITEMGQRTITKAAPEHLVSVRTHVLDHVATSEVSVMADALERLATKAKRR